MSYDSAPPKETAPSFDDVVEYALVSNLYGKLSLTKFYDYYHGFKPHNGVVMDWRKKMHEWAQNQRSTVVISAKEYEAVDRIKKKREGAQHANTAKEIWKRVEAI